MKTIREADLQVEKTILKTYARFIKEWCAENHCNENCPFYKEQDDYNGFNCKLTCDGAPNTWII